MLVLAAAVVVIAVLAAALLLVRAGRDLLGEGDADRTVEIKCPFCYGTGKVRKVAGE